MLELKMLNLVSMFKNTTKIEESRPNVSSLKGENKSFQANYQQLSHQEKSITVAYKNNESNVNSKILINDSISENTQMSKSVNNRVERTKNVIAFNLKEQDDKKKLKNWLAIYVPLSSEEKLYSNVLVLIV